MNDELSSNQAAHMLDSIKESQAAMRRALRAHSGHWYLWIWGAAWLGMALLGQFLGTGAEIWMNVLALVGLAASALVGFVQAGHIRKPVDRRFLALLGTLVAFDYFVWPSVLGPLISGPVDSDIFVRMFAYNALIPMQAYILGGIWLHNNFFLWIGILISCSILLGLYAFSAIFWLWFGALAASPLILSGFYIRYFLRCDSSHA